MAEGLQAAAQRFTAHRTNKLRNVECFRYLCRIISHNNNDTPEMWQNLTKARGTCRQVSKILTFQEVPAPVSSMIYQVVVVAMLLYGSESWVLPPSGIWVFEGFHVKAACRLIGMSPQQRTFGPCLYPKSKEVMRAAQLQIIVDYVG